MPDVLWLSRGFEKNFRVNWEKTNMHTTEYQRVKTCFLNHVSGTGIDRIFTCSECDSYLRTTYNYCHSCGSKMEQKNEV